METNVSVLITDSALESLALYHQTSPDHARRIEKIITSFRHAEIDGRVVKLADTPRPLWQCDVDGEHCVYLTIGQGNDCIEARISFFGSPLPDSDESYKELLFLSGEAQHAMLPATVHVEDSRMAAHWPPLPQRTVSSLEHYLKPTEDELLEVLADPRPMDDLNGRPFRFLNEVRAPIDLPPRLSPEQTDVLTRPRPMFLQGVAGSGKTTLLTHFAHQELVRSRNEAAILMIAYTEPLKQFIQRLLGSMRHLDDADISRVQVSTWRELCEQLASRLELNPFRWAPPSHFANFANGKLPPRRGDTDVDLIPELEELIRSVIKGETADSAQSLLERGAFLSRTDIGLDRYIARADAYDIARQYQYFLTCDGRCDDLDAARLLMHHRSDFPHYDYVLVDETQDYALTQLRLMASLAKEPEGLFFAGDMDQAVYPSHFSWEKVRTAVYQVWKKPPPPRQRIRYNYRNPQPVTRIGDALLGMKVKALALDRADQEKSLSNQAATPVPIRIQVTREEATVLVRHLAVQVGSLGVIQESEQHLNIEGVEFQRTFTPRTVKGLEFNVVCLIGYNALYRDLTRRTRRKLTPRQTLLKSNEVYVSVTRTRGQLLLIDENPKAAGLWDAPEFADCIINMDRVGDVMKLVTARYKLSSRDEWRVSALDFEAQHAYSPAGECWERAGMPKNAAAAYEKGGLLKKAQSLYKAVGDRKSAARLAEELEDFGEAARLYAAEEQWARAARCWAKDGNFAFAADAWKKCGDILEAAASYVKARKNAEAAACFEQAGRWRDAAREWQSARRFFDASRCFDLAGRRKEAWECAARYWEEQQDFAKAAAEWQKLRNIDNACRCWVAAGHLGAAQKLFHAAGRLRESAGLLSKMELHAEAGDEFKAARSMKEAAAEYRKAGRWSTAGDAWAACGAVAEAISCYEKAGDWRTVGELWLGEGNERKAAEAFERAEDWSRAAETWTAAQNASRAASNYERVSDWKAAAREWYRAGNSAKAEECLRRAAVHVAAELPSQPLFKAVPAPPKRPWHFTIEDNTENRKFLQIARMAGELDPALADAHRSLLHRLVSPVRPGAPALRDAHDMLRHAAMEYVPSLTSIPMIHHEANRYAELFEYIHRFDLAAALWEQAGEQSAAIRCQMKLGRPDAAYRIICTMPDPAQAANELCGAGFHLEAGLRFIDVGLYLRATSSLDLAGHMRLATIAKALQFEADGNAEGAQVIWDSVGFRATQEELRQSVAELLDSRDMAAAREQAPGFFRGVWASIRRFLGAE